MSNVKSHLKKNPIMGFPIRKQFRFEYVFCDLKILIYCL